VFIRVIKNQEDRPRKYTHSELIREVVLSTIRILDPSVDFCVNMDYKRASLKCANALISGRLVDSLIQELILITFAASIMDGYMSSFWV
jgi:hypothetical protein